MLGCNNNSGCSRMIIGVFIEQGKWKRLVIHPLLTIGMYFLRILVGLRFLMSKLARHE